jgi:ketosteroid isomerase-like protein
MDGAREIDQLASTFFAAIERADLDAIEACYADNVEVWINVNPRPQGREASVKLLRSFTKRVEGLRYEVEFREFFPGGFVQRHRIRGKTRSGEPLDVPVALVVHVENGCISRLFEYMDSEAIAPVFA